MESKNFFNRLKDHYLNDEITIYETEQPFSLSIDCLKKEEKSKHTWYYYNLDEYLTDAHADIQLKAENLPDIIRNSTLQFTSDTILNTNEGSFQAKNPKFFANIADESNLYVGLFSFSKAFLLKNYVVNQDQALCDLIFKSLMEYNNLNPNEWVIKGALHKNTSLFHFHFKLYQKANSLKYKETNFSPLALKYTKNQIEKYFSQIQTANNENNAKNFKLQQAYVKYAQQTTLMMNLANNMLDLALCNHLNFNDMFQTWTINFLLVQPAHLVQYNNFISKINNTIQMVISSKNQQFNTKLLNKEITWQEYQEQSVLWKQKLQAWALQLKDKWLNNWTVHLAEMVCDLWTKNIGEVCSDYVSYIKDEAVYHTLKVKDLNKPYLYFCSLNSSMRKRYNKAVLYLTSLYMADHAYYDDASLYEEINNIEQTESIDSLNNLINLSRQTKKQDLTWNSMSQMILSKSV